MPDSPPVLVTGSHRSGTTWVGRTLAYARNTAYIHEPFNPDSDRGLCAASFDGQYTYVNECNEATYSPAIEDTLAFRYRPWARITSRPGIRARLWSLAAVSIRWPQFLAYRLLGRRSIIKDPIALFSAPWLANRFDADVIVLIRHPAAFAGSLKSKDWEWRFDFDCLLSQPDLMNDYLSNFVDELRTARDTNLDPVDEAVVLWRMFYTVIDRYRTDHPGWQFIRHEDLSRRPKQGFETLFEAVGLPMNSQIVERIEKDTSSCETADQFGIQRDSRANITRWKKRLTDEEIERVRSGTSDVWPLFYDESDW